MAYTTLNTIPPGSAANSEFPLFGVDTGYHDVGPDTYGSDYGLLLTQLKDFLCGFFVKPTFSGAGDGTFHSFDMIDAASIYGDGAWTVTFTSAVDFNLERTFPYALYGPYTLAPPVEGVYPTVKVTLQGFTFSITQGDTPFSIGDTFSFSINQNEDFAGQEFEVVVDTARGIGANQVTVTEVLKYIRSTNTEAAYETFGQYSSDSQADDGTCPVAITKLVYYDQQSLNETLFVDFRSATEYRLKRYDRATGIYTILATGTIDEFLDYRSPTLSVGLTVSKNGSGAAVYFDLAGANGTAALPLVKYVGHIGAPSGTRTILRITPPTNGSAGDTRVTRVLTLKSRGLLGTDSIYYTFCQRVGGVNNGDRWYLDCQLHKNYNPALGVHEQVNMSPPARIILQQGNDTYFYFIADGRGFKLLTRMLPSNDFQVLMGGFFLPHSTPTSYPWPGYVAGTIGNGNFDAVAGAAPIATDHSPGFNPGVVTFSPADHGYTKSSTLWVCLQTQQWLPGANHSSGVIGSPSQQAKDLSAVASGFDAIYVSPWIHRTGPTDNGTARRACRISSNCYGDPATKFMLPGMLKLGSDLFSGVLGELPGVFFIGESPSSSVVADDIVGNSRVWGGTVVANADAAVLAAFDLG